MIQGGRRFKKHDYHQKKYANPLFQKKKRSFFDFAKFFSQVNIKSTLSVFILLALAGLLFWFFLISKTFLITNLTFDIPAKYAQGEIAQLVWQEASQKTFFLSRHNLLLFDSIDLSDLINQRYTISNLKITKKFPHSLAISFQDKVYRLLWQEAGHNYFISPEDGTAKEVDLSLIKADGLPIIINNGEGQVVENHMTDTEIPSFIFNIYTNISKNSKYKIENFRVGGGPGLIEIKFKEGPVVKMTPQEGLDKQLEKLYNIINIKLKDDFKNKSYIDVRYGDTVYIK